jgi:hypothetical protein
MRRPVMDASTSMGSVVATKPIRRKTMPEIHTQLRRDIVVEQRAVPERNNQKA